jgi:type 1 glutamine amidotransferase
MSKPLLFVCVALIGAAMSSAAAPAANPKSPGAGRPLRVVFVSGAESYNTDQGFADLAEYLRREHGMQCEVLRMSADQKSIVGIERLLEADTAVFHVRRKTLNDGDLAILKRFFESGRGFVALRSTSHGWENWRDFDQTVLGAKYGGPGGNNFGTAVQLHPKPHPIWKGAEGLDTKRDLYRITEVAPDVNVILEGETKNGRVPVGWTRTYRGARLFYLALGYNQDMEQPAFRRAIANAIHWVTEPATNPGRKR